MISSKTLSSLLTTYEFHVVRSLQSLATEIFKDASTFLFSFSEAAGDMPEQFCLAFRIM